MAGQWEVSTHPETVLSATVLGKRRAENEWEDDDFAQVKRARYDLSTDGPSMTETDQASIEAQFDTEALLAFINSNAIEIGDSPGASSADYTDYAALFNIVPLTPTTQNDAEDIADDAAEDAVHGAVDAAAEDATDDAVDDAGPVLMSQYKLGVDLAETSQTPARDSQIVLFSACTGCHDSKVRCQEWTLEGCLKCRMNHKPCVPRPNVPIVKAERACVHCRMSKHRCSNQILDDGRRTICVRCKNGRGRCCIYLPGK
ncbi:hypothetical protein OBBRIDRAFT_794634 [Obba rivulosa]|uniref:Zn(2)-C6 fungal-type domain-containing protein n=1 Tax=Obba rivulosa TaxID=1052685 RepID=A0A8E2DJH7_9APHY|nr:hypothetical protein OBBRIDRAFT_794634 [Obba rivulosa]